MPVLGEAVSALADRADHIGDERAAGGIAVQRHDFVEGFIHRGAHEIVHRGVHDEETLSGAALEVLHFGQEHAGVADHEAAGLQQNLKPERLKQGHERRAVSFRRERTRPGGLGVPPSGAAAGESVFVDDADAATDREIGDAILRLQLGGERRDFGHGLGKRPDLGELRTDVHLHAAQLDVGVFRRGFVGGGGELERDAKFVVALARRDLGVRVGVDIGVDPDRDGRLHPEFARDVVDAGELGFALDVERENPALQCQLDFGLGLADAGKDAALHIRTGGQHAAQLASAHQIERCAQLCEVAEHGETRVGLHGVADLHIQPVQTAGQPVVVVRHRRRARDVGRRAVEPGDLGEIDRLAV